MRTLRVYGYSDDLVESEGIDGADEFPAYDGTTPYRGRLEVKDGTYTVEIHAIYAGSWAFAICPQDGNFDNMPPWEIRRTFGDRCPCSETIEIDLPHNAVCKWRNRDGDTE